MFQRAPGELDPFANGNMSDEYKIQTIKDNLRARQQAPNYTGFLTEEEADFLFGAVDRAKEEAEEAAGRAVAAESAAEESEEAAENLRADIKDLNDKISNLEDEIEELRNNKDATP